MNFEPLNIQTGQLLDLSDNAYPTIVHGWKDGNLSLSGENMATATHFGMVTEGDAVLHSSSGSHKLTSGMFFVCPGTCELESTAGAGLIISRLAYRGLWQIGGPIEPVGRLVYIDGCTDTLLASPPRLGDPCLNHLHIPPCTNQSPHTHPSERIGVILRGSGECRTSDGCFALSPGMGWRIPTGCLHSFYTQESSLDVVAWHPESDFGPTDQNHPMKNRTILPGS